MLSGDVDKARAAVNAATTASPMDAGALAMRAQLAWDKDRDEAAAMKDLSLVTDGKAKAHASAIDQARAYSLQGWIHLSRGRVAEARTAFDTASKLDPSSGSALLGQGEVFYKEGRFSEALSHFDTAIQKDPTNPRAVVDDAKTKIALEHLADAKAQLLAARQTMPKSLLVALWLGKAEETLGNRKPAEADYIDAIGLVDPKAEDAILPYMALAELLANGGRADEAAAKLAEAQKNLPDSAGMQRALGAVAAVQGNYDEAIRHYQAAVTKDPQDLTSRFQLGVTYRKMQKLDEAGAAFQAVADADKDYPQLSVERGLLAQQTGHVDQALAEFAAALAKAPDDLEVQLHVGEALVLIGKVEDALVTLRKVIVKKSQSAEANHFLGRAMFMQGTDMVGAKKYLQKAVDIDANEAEYHMYVAWIANESGDLGTADIEIHKALAINKLLPEAYWQRGALLRVKAAVDDAIKDLNKALQLKPTLYQAHAELAQCYADKNDVNAAMAQWRMALAGDGDRPFWNYRYGKLLLDRGTYAEAAQHLAIATAWAAKIEAEKSKTDRPSWAIPAEFAAGVALQKSGKKAEAIEHYKRFLDLAPPNSPDKRDAMAALQAMGAPYENR
jgi:tetratricopeptide (TPR) repeat protein